MSGADHPIQGDKTEGHPAGLLDLAMSMPSLGRERAQLSIRQGGGSAPSVAWQALGLAERETGDIAVAIRHLRRSVKVADINEDRERQADVRASLATTLTLAGRTKEALTQLDVATAIASGPTASRISMRRGFVLWALGRYDEALDELRACIPVLREDSDAIWEARALLIRAMILVERGATRRADDEFARAAELFDRAGQQVESARVWQDRGWARYRSGDIPAALDLLTVASEMFAAAAVPEPSVEIDWCTALLAAGLTDEARAHARRAQELTQARVGSGVHRADVELTLAETALAAGAPEIGRQHAAKARRAYLAQERERGARLARLVEARARWAAGERNGRLLAQVTTLAGQLRDLRAVEASMADLLAGRIASALDRTDIANKWLGLAARQRNRGSALERTTGWLAQALRAHAAGSPRGVFAAARAGLRVLDEHRLSLGATEMRAAATAHGAELAALALRHAAGGRSVRNLLTWSERWRATTLALPPVRPPRDRALTADLGRLREMTHKISEVRSTGSSTEPLDRERRRLEDAIRARSLTTPGDSTRSADRFDVAELLGMLDGHVLVSSIAIDEELCVLVANADRVRRFRAGRIDEAAREVDFARFGLRTAAGTGQSRAQRSLQRIEVTSERLQALLLGDAVRVLGDEPIILVPPARLHATPWAVLPALRGRAFTVAPSALSWMRARRRRPPRRRDVVLVAGPDLGSRGAEIAALQEAYPHATVLANEEATCEPVLKTLDGAWLAHIAAHGTLRSDNPLFSALGLHDGPLTVYDLERLRRAPYRLILSACESGIGATAGADEVLGLASALISLGTAGMMGSTVIVDDEAAARVSLIVHERLQAGDDLAQALLTARARTADDPVAHATALAFVALGAA